MFQNKPRLGTKLQLRDNVTNHIFLKKKHTLFQRWFLTFLGGGCMFEHWHKWSKIPKKWFPERSMIEKRGSDWFGSEFRRPWWSRSSQADAQQTLQIRGESNERENMPPKMSLQPWNPAQQRPGPGTPNPAGRTLLRGRLSSWY